MRKRDFNKVLAAGFMAPVAAWAHTGGVTPPPLAHALKAPAKLDVPRYLVSEKFDGVRAFWDGGALLSRQGLPIGAPLWFTSRLPRTALDGELWMGRGRFEAVSAAVRRVRPQDSEWTQIKYMLFELPQAPGSFEQRYEALRALVGAADWTALQAVEQSRLSDENQLAALLANTVRAGGEGLVLHDANAPYISGRTEAVLKLKPQDDDEAVVLGQVPGQGRLQGRMGALRVRNHAGQEFLIGTGFSDAQRLAPPAIGATISYRYRGVTNSGLPRFASFWRQLEV